MNSNLKYLFVNLIKKWVKIANYEELNPGNSITERLRNAGQYLGVSRREIANEMTRFADSSNTRSMREMFDAYLEWEMKAWANGVSEEQIEELAMRNFDVVAKFADNQLITKGDDRSALVMTAEQNNSRAGRITRFYRSVVGFNPEGNGIGDN